MEHFAQFTRIRPNSFLPLSVTDEVRLPVSINRFPVFAHRGHHRPNYSVHSSCEFERSEKHRSIKSNDRRKFPCSLKNSTSIQSISVFAVEDSRGEM